MVATRSIRKSGHRNSWFSSLPLAICGVAVVVVALYGALALWTTNGLDGIGQMTVQFQTINQIGLKI